MQKKAMRNFIYSFLFSLSVSIIIGKGYFAEPEANTQNTLENAQKKQDISLFSQTPEILDIQNDQTQIDVSSIEALTSININESLDIKAESSELNNAALASIDGDISKQTENSNIKTDLAYSQEIFLDSDPVAQDIIPEITAEDNKIIYSDISDTLKDEQLQSINVVNNNKAKPSATIVYSGNQMSDTDISPISEDIHAATPFKTAQYDPDEESDIPLSENAEVLHHSIEISSSAHASEIAMLEPAALVSNISEIDEEPSKTLAEADLKQNEWTQMSERTDEDSPWVIAKGNKFAKNKIIVEQFAEADTEDDSKETEQNNDENKQITESVKPETVANTEQSTKLAYQMVPNLLIPIPEDIANDPNLTPQLSVTPQNKDNSKEEKKNENKEPQKDTSLDAKDKESGLFKNITSWFAGDDTKKQKENASNKDSKEKSFSFFGKSNYLKNNDANQQQILPAELRLSFQPNRAEISGNTLRWIHAFADNVLTNDDMYIEIRIDGTSSFALQKKRLNLLSTIFANRGVDFRKINIVFTSREPNSFIIRNIRFNNNEEVVENKNGTNPYYRPW